MRLLALAIVAAASVFPIREVRAQPSSSFPAIGEEYEISRSYETSHRGSNGSSGNSRGRNAILERVIGVRETGVELEYDLPRDATPQDRKREWQFPVRILKSRAGTMQLLNGRELEMRLGAWLKAAKLTRAACGRIIFTWNAFQIECDPEAVIGTIQSFDITSADLREGAAYQDAEARSPGTLARRASGLTGATFFTLMQIEPKAVRHAQAEADVAVGEITGKPITLAAALREREGDAISGTIAVTFEVDASGNARRWTKTTKLEIKRPDSSSESRTATEIVERRLLSASTTR